VKKLLVLASVLVGLLLVSTPRSEACHTHGYVRASTLNELFQSLPGEDQNLSFSAGGLSNTSGSGGTNQLSQVNPTSIDTSTFDDGHQFQWSVKGGEFGSSQQWANSTDNVYGELEGIIGDIELALDAQYDKEYAD
jgi:hypothetical protein